uniref:Uncharacterized protein n=1 Tax=Oryza glumipatula TaxID=40148 RepID=A0A0D9YRT0_9ORYZ
MVSSRLHRERGKFKRKGKAMGTDSQELHQYYMEESNSMIMNMNAHNKAARQRALPRATRLYHSGFLLSF